MRTTGTKTPKNEPRAHPNDPTPRITQGEESLARLVPSRFVPAETPPNTSRGHAKEALWQNPTVLTT